MKTTIRAKLVAKQDSIYKLLVFQNLDETENSLLRYITTTKLPNWNGQDPEIGDTGFLECEYVDAGDNYFQRNTGSQEQYKYTSCYFLNFIKDKETITTKDYNF